MVEHLDKEGFDTLEVISQADNFNRWMFGTLRPFIHGKVLEVGSGIGNISGLLLKDGFSVMLSDQAASYTQLLRKRFHDVKGFNGVLSMDLMDPQFDEKFSIFFGTFDTIIALNVIEHIEDDHLAIANCRKLLAMGGRLVVLVPAYDWLFNRFDKELGHHRRYNKKTLAALLGARLEVETLNYFNLGGITGWIVSGSIMRNKIIPAGQMRLFNKLVPLFRLLDRLTLRRAGLSVWGVARKIS